MKTRIKNRKLLIEVDIDQMKSGKTEIQVDGSPVIIGIQRKRQPNQGRFCRECGAKIPKEDAYPRKAGGLSWPTWCRKCNLRRLYAKNWTKRGPEKINIELEKLRGFVLELEKLLRP